MKTEENQPEISSKGETVFLISGVNGDPHQDPAEPEDSMES